MSFIVATFPEQENVGFGPMYQRNWLASARLVQPAKRKPRSGSGKPEM
jgi:hypothetical protein